MYFLNSLVSVPPIFFRSTFWPTFMIIVPFDLLGMPASKQAFQCLFASIICIYGIDRKLDSEMRLLMTRASVSGKWDFKRGMPAHAP